MIIKNIQNEINKYNQIKKSYEFNNIDIYPYNKNRLYKNSIFKIYNFNYNNYINLDLYSSKYVLNLMNILQFINIDNNILLICKNLNLLKIILNNLNINNNIYLLIVDLYNIEELLLLKKKYNNLHIYIFYTINYNTFNNIKLLLKNKVFSTILFDIDNTDINFLISILLTHHFLSNDGCYINIYKLPSIFNNQLIYYFNKLYNCFYNSNFEDELFFNVHYKYSNMANVLLIFNNIKKKLSTKDINNIIYLINNYEKTNNNNDIKLSKKFLKYIYLRWKIVRLAEQNNYIRMKKMNIITTNSNIDVKNYIPEKFIYINDIKVINKLDLNYNLHELNNYNLYCNFYEKRILLLYILIFTLISEKNNINEYIIVINKFVIINLYKILLKLFPKIKLYIFDKDINIDINNKNINIYNEEFDNNKNYYFLNNKKIIYISNYENNLISKLENMINETNIGIKINANFIITNFYIFEKNINLSNNISDLNIDNIVINNIDLVNKSSDSFLFYKGKLLIHSYTNDLTISIMIEKENNKYNLDIYNINDNKQKYYNYLLYYKYFYCIRCVNKYLECLPGYELLKLEYNYEWNLLINYYKIIHNIDDNQFVFNKFFKIFFITQKLTNIKVLKCKLNTLSFELKKTNKYNDYNKYIKLLSWFNINQIYLYNSSLNQIQIILTNKDKVLNKKQINKIIKYLEKNVNSDKIYYKLLL